MKGSASILTGTTSIITKSGTVKYTATVTDERGNSASDTQIITVEPYAIPVFGSFAVQRATASGSMQLSYRVSCALVNGQNYLVSLKVYSKLSSDSIWPSTPLKTFNLSGTSASDSVILSGFDEASSYDFKAELTDACGGTQIDITSTSTDFKILNISSDKKRISIGKLSEESVDTNKYEEGKLFDCAMPARFLKNLEFGEDVQGKLRTNYSTDNGYLRNIVYIETGQEVDGGEDMMFAIHNRSVYVAGENNDGLVTLGSSGRKWNQLYAVNDTIATSDRKVKKNITEMSDIQEQLFDKLRPVTYEMVNGTSGRTHYGFVSQDVEEAMEELGLTGKDFAGFCKDIRVDSNGQAMVDQDGQKIYNYALRYAEFVALNTHMIKKLQQENSLLRQEVQELKDLIMSSTSSNRNA